MKKPAWIPETLHLSLLVLAVIFLILLNPALRHSEVHAAENSLCARVKIEIKQELTLERQAFDAHMKITNGLSHISLENIGVTIKFQDAEGISVLTGTDPQNTEAKFFIGAPLLSGITDVTGSGSIDPSSAADIHWLIIPAPGTAGGTPEGAVYYIGATLSYTMGGEIHTMEVAPDYITVKPMPEMTIDYFLTRDIFGDDAFTQEIEPPVPFSLGVRVKNAGMGTARGMKINSAQPKIVENDQQLLIGFHIESTEVNGRPAEKTLLANLGDIMPDSAAVARWTMTCALSGQFEEFTADFSHADELGGELTSLITGGPSTHFLIRNVLVDLPGRDEIGDFLALDGSTLRVYESDSTTDVTVTDRSLASILSGLGNEYFLSAPVTSSFMYVKLPDPNRGNKEIRDVIRSDGKRIKPENAWISKIRSANHGWDYFFNLFDAGSTGTYTIVCGDPSTQPQAPVLQFIPDRRVIEGQSLSFLVEASNPDGGAPALNAGNLPAGATFADQKNGTGIFTWNTAVGQAGSYSITFTATNGALTSSQRARTIVTPIWDTDGDEMSDAWEMQHFATLDRDGTGDYDGDGIRDLQEYLRDTNPTKKDPHPNNRGPSIPRIQTPGIEAEIGTMQPTLTVVNSTDPDGDSLHYTFELYGDEAMATPVEKGLNIAASAGTTSWQVTIALNDHGHYYWRCRATDGIIASQWVYGNFFVNTANEDPGPFRASSPRTGGAVDTRMPMLQVTNSRDADEDTLTYTFSLYADSVMMNPVALAASVPEGADGTTSWTVNVRLADNATYYWKAVATDEHGATKETPSTSFLVKTINVAPLAPVIRSPAVAGEISQEETDLTVDNTTDSNGENLAYTFELDEVNTFDSPALRSSGAHPPGVGTTSWHVDGLKDNTRYFWRVKASDGTADSPWRQGRFFVNASNDTPSVPVVGNPGADAWTDTVLPVLVVNTAGDADDDRVHYRFQLYGDPSYAALIEEKDAASPQAVVSQLMDSAWYYWRAQAIDEHGADSAWTETVAFFVKDSGLIEPPEMIVLDPWWDMHTQDSIAIRWLGSPPDSSADVSLYYDTDSVGEDGTLIVSGIKPNPGGNTWLWDTTGVPEGAYYLYGIIATGGSKTSGYSPARIVVDRTPPALSVAPPVGIYNGTQTVILTANEDAVIYFTLDGSDPSAASAVYSMPIQISEATMVKAVAADRAGNCSTVLTSTYTIQRDITVEVATNTGRTINNVKVYAFTARGSYTGRNATTDTGGIARFNPTDFSPGSYTFRVDYMGYQFWSSLVTLPGTASLAITIDEAEAAVSVETAAGSAAGVKVYLFTAGGSYLGISRQTDAAGVAVFNVPAGKNYKFRVDTMGNQYWSSVTTMAGGTVNAVTVAIGGGVLQVAVVKGAGDPMPGLMTYLFSASGSYLGRSLITDAAGIVRYSVPAGSYKIRVDYLGYLFWIDTTAVNTDTSVELAIAHKDVHVMVNGIFHDSSRPMPSVPVYLFTSTGTYLGQIRQTDGTGRALFNLPQVAYKVRADYLGRQFWSDSFTWQDATVNIALADATVTVTGSGQPHAGVPVYVFNTTGSYLNISGLTDTNGSSQFRLPTGPYKFRADYQMHQYWSGTVTLAANDARTVSITTGAGTFALTVVKGAGDPLVGALCYAFTSAGSYLGVSGTTNSSGQVIFNLSSGSYKFRVDYMGYQFWSDMVTLPGTAITTMLIAEADVSVKVLTSSGPATGVMVHLFTGGSTYLGISGQTDAAGMVSFRLPVGMNYKFRADILGGQYWSPVTMIVSGMVNNVSVAAGGGVLHVAISKGAGNPLAGVTTYLHDASGNYLKQNRITDAAGMVHFSVPAGSYTIRVDYLGSPFWSETTVVNGDTPVELVIPHRDVGVTVNGVFQSAFIPMADVPVYLFSQAGTYLGQDGQTDGTGRVVFTLPEAAYKVRADYLGRQFWSEPFTWRDASVQIPLADAVVTVMSGSSQPHTGVPVSVFSTVGSYLGLSGQTNENGTITFRTPAGSYKFRADYQMHQYWSGDEILTANDTKSISILTGSGNFTLTVLKNGSDPLVSGSCSVFTDSGSYLGLSGTTNSSGQATFALSSASYKFRLDYMGYQFWSDTVTVPDVTSGTLTIPHRDITVSVNGMYRTTEPLSGIATYLFTSAGSYVSQSLTTDSAGQAVYHLPMAAYKIRVDYRGYQFWSDTFQGQNATVTINEGAALIHARQGGNDVTDATVHLFSESGSYLGVTVTTDTAGTASFIVPDRPYKFRVDVDGSQYWSSIVTVTAGMENHIAVNCD